MKQLKRCKWSETNELLMDYHDREWGVPVRDDRLLFEMLNLEGAQAGLSWLTVLKKRSSYKEAFDNFDAEKVKRFTPAKQAKLMKNEGIVRNRLKISSVVSNAEAYLAVQKEFGTFSDYIWAFVGHKPMAHREAKKALAVSEVMSKDLKKRGFRFVGATICFAFMQGIGMINDHDPKCFRSKQI